MADLLDLSPDNILAVGHFNEEITPVFNDAVLGLHLEGLVAKRDDSIYAPDIRSRDLGQGQAKGRRAGGEVQSRAARQPLAASADIERASLAKQSPERGMHASRRS